MRRNGFGGHSSRSNVGDAFVRILVACIIGIAVTIPIVLSVIDSAAVGSTTATVLDLVPLFLGLVLLVSVAGSIMRRVR